MQAEKRLWDSQAQEPTGLVWTKGDHSRHATFRNTSGTNRQIITIGTQYELRAEGLELRRRVQDLESGRGPDTGQRPESVPDLGEQLRELERRLDRHLGREELRRSSAEERLSSARLDGLQQEISACLKVEDMDAVRQDLRRSLDALVEDKAQEVSLHLKQQLADSSEQLSEMLQAHSSAQGERLRICEDRLAKLAFGALQATEPQEEDQRRRQAPRAAAAATPGGPPWSPGWRAWRGTLRASPPGPPPGTPSAWRRWPQPPSRPRRTPAAGASECSSLRRGSAFRRRRIRLRVSSPWATTVPLRWSVTCTSWTRRCGSCRRISHRGSRRR
ncbi:unnamed protein product [Effrenium voratum]|nr:unnamed protein product [Effrenium voratum]